MLRRTKKAVAEVVSAVAGDPVDLLGKKLADARQAVTNAKITFAEAALEAELANAEGLDAATRRKATAAEALRTAQARLDDLRGAAQAHAAREAQRQAQDAQAELARRRDLTLQHAAKRRAVADRCEKAITELVKVRDELMTGTADILAAWPHKNPDVIAMMLRPADADIALRLALVKAGVPWAGPALPIGRDAMPTLQQRLSNADAEIAMRLERDASR